MIERMEITGRHYEADEKLRRYVHKKLGAVDKYVPKRMRESLHAEVLLKAESKGASKYTAEITMHLPTETINVRESALNMYAAVDILETTLKNRVRKFKELHDPSLYRRLATRVRRDEPAETPAQPPV